LIFEDLDTIITPNVRSYFFNEVDGLKSNDGIFMVGSTNHLDQLDPGISKRPSRFDRKYYFPNPNEKEREEYARFWQTKLKNNKDVEFPDALCRAIAGITEDFSFAYLQEAFVASLLAIAGRKQTPVDKHEESKSDVAHLEKRLNEATQIERSQMSGKDMATQVDNDHDKHELDKLILWKEMRKQVTILREEMDERVDRK